MLLVGSSAAGAAFGMYSGNLRSCAGEIKIGHRPSTFGLYVEFCSCHVRTAPITRQNYDNSVRRV